jgi:hypothetical protein
MMDYFAVLCFECHISYINVLVFEERNKTCQTRMSNPS